MKVIVARHMMDSRRKRRREESPVDINDVLFSINRFIIRCIHDSEMFYLRGENRSHIPKLIEYSLRTDELTISSFLLYFLKKEISKGNGLSINGQPRGLSTRIMIDVIEWRALKRTALEHHYNTFAAERSRKIFNVMTPEPKSVTKIEPYDAASIKRILG